ncbi:MULTISPECIES: hypothetical protein [unclassified Haladaptatus]|uniref:hypothetical protein n=1 Tax=unclassified Haladaptatus TaxID=2622732 RepID=UPI00209BCE3B|nr:MULTISPECIES: hypothetical protein [unclassified Haladaptatus]MCO8245262.1 hypothetical protein [Haladaptatus sp. AB643]MCO8253407.1 hypothetical protein [Haladaptatus sp. AB618]
MNIEVETDESAVRPWNSADVSGLSASEVEEYVQTATEDGAVHFERKGGRTFVVIGE